MSWLHFSPQVLQDRQLTKQELSFIENNIPRTYKQLKYNSGDSSLTQIIFKVYEKISQDKFELYSKVAYGIVLTTPDTSGIDTEFIVTLLENVENIYFWKYYKLLEDRKKKIIIRKFVQNPLTSHRSHKFVNLLKEMDFKYYGYASRLMIAYDKLE